MNFKNFFPRLVRRSRREFNERVLHPIIVKNKQKIFCIGLNKTGTTSLIKTIESFDIIIGGEISAAKLADDYLVNNFEPIVKFCKSAQAFKDIPFSLPDTYKYIDAAYPDSKFILTVRDNSEQWYQSMVNYLTKWFGKGSIPTSEVLKNNKFIRKGLVWDLFRTIYKTPEDDILNKELLIQNYEQHNQEVIEYFHEKKNLLVINLAQQGSYQIFCDFMGVKSPLKDFPWIHKTENLQVRNR